MERDFMGLSFNDDVVMKEDYVEGQGKASGKGCARRSSNFPLPIQNKAPALPQYMPVTDEKPPKNGHSSAHQIQDFQMHPSSIMSPFVKTRFGSSQNFGGGSIEQQLFGGNHLMDPQPILPSATSFAGTTDHWMNPKASPAPAQLTIFYGGAINVFDDISPDKAQALMFMAQNVVIPTPKHPKLAPADWPRAMSSFANLPSHPLSASSHTIDHDQVKACKKLRRSTSILNKVEPSIVIPPTGSAAAVAAASAMISSAVPQSRKASLARFLEKRKERAMCAMPYNLNNRAVECVTPDSNGFGFSATSGVCSDICNT